MPRRSCIVVALVLALAFQAWPIEIQPREKTVELGDTIRFTSDGDTEATWSLDGDGRMDASGLFTATAPGKVSVVVKAGGAEARAIVTVTLTSDVTPKRGRGRGPDGVEGPGPWIQRICEAISEDGLKWERTGRCISDQAGVPNGIVDLQGRARVYYNDLGNGNNLTCAIEDEGAWVYKRIRFTEVEDPHLPCDPTVLLTDDRKYRLYFTYDAQTWSAISLDGVHFDIEDGCRMKKGRDPVLDPNVVRIGKEYHFFAGGCPSGNYHAVSTNGLEFRPLDKVVVGDRSRNIVFANGIAVEEGCRYYVFDNMPERGSKKAIYSAFSTDGMTWELEADARLRVEDDTTGLESGWVGDPSVVRLTDGTFRMYYNTDIPKGRR